MTKRRAIYGTAATSISLARCCPEAQLLFDRLVSQADDQGRLQGDALLVKAQCMPLIDKATTRSVDRWLGELAEHGMILRYESAGQPLIQIVKWWDHQDWMRHIYGSRWSPPDGWEQDRIKGSGDRQDAANPPPTAANLRPNDGDAPAQVSGGDSDSGEDVIVSEIETSRGGDAREASTPPQEPVDFSLHKITTTHGDLFGKAPNIKAVGMYRDLLTKTARGSLDAVIRAMYYCWNSDRAEYGFVKRVKERLLQVAA